MSASVFHVGVTAAALLGLSACALERPILSTDAETETLRPATPSATSDEQGAARPRTLFGPQAGDGRAKAIDPVVEPGTGRLIGQPKPPAEAMQKNEAGEISLNVVDADVREVVRLVLEDGLGANYIIDPTVTGSITIRTSRPVPSDDVLPLLNAVLSANGAALIQQDDLFKIVPIEQSAIAGGRPDTRLTLDGSGTGSGVLIAPLRYTDAAELAVLLEPFLLDRGTLTLDAGRNTLLLTGSADQITTISELIDIFDVDWMAGMSFGFFPLESALPTDLAIELDQIFGREEEDDAGGQVVRFVPIDRLNALLVITAQPDYLQRAETWIQRLDRTGEGNEEQIYVYPVQNGRATDLASVLGELFDIRSTVIGPELLLAPGLRPIEFGSPFSPDEADPRRDEDRSPADERTAFGRADPLAERLPPDARQLTEGREGDTTKIVADEGNNALLIRALPTDYRKIEAALRELDKAPLQVLLEATIAEVTLRDELRYGVQWFFDSNSTSFTLSDDVRGDVEPNFPGFAGILSRGDVRVVIDALDEVSDVQVISSPQLLVLDNQTARLEVGDEVPIIVQQAQGIEDDARLINTVEQRQTGVILDVTPRVNANGLVVLDILQEVSDVVVTDTSDIDSPTISQRRVGTTVAVDSAQTVALGGLIQDDVTRGQAGVPLLSRIPLIGWLFGATVDRNERTELLILITPRVLNDTRSAVAATEELRRRLRAVAPLEARIGERFGPVEDDRQASVEPTSPTDDRYFLVQLASLSDEAAARTAWRNFERAHRETLEGLAPRFEPYEVDGRRGVSVRAGPLASFAMAEGICRRLRTEGADCLVIEKR